MDKNDILKLANHQGLFSYFDLEGDSVGQLMLYRLVRDCMEVERDRIIAANAPEIEAVNAHIKSLENAVAAEREACAKVCDELAARDKLSNYYKVAANAIRARGNHAND